SLCRADQLAGLVRQRRWRECARWPACRCRGPARAQVPCPCPILVGKKRPTFPIARELFRRFARGLGKPSAQRALGQAASVTAADGRLETGRLCVISTTTTSLIEVTPLVRLGRFPLRHSEGANHALFQARSW